MIEITFYRLFIYVNVYVVKEETGIKRDKNQVPGPGYPHPDACPPNFLLRSLLFCFNFTCAGAGNINTIKCLFSDIMKQYYGKRFNLRNL